jgi:hypothetical protein
VKRILIAVLLAPLTAPVLYWIGALAVAILDPSRQVGFDESLSALGMMLAFGSPVAYVATVVAVGPALWLQRRFGPRALAPVLLLGTIVGVATAIVIGPPLRGELIRVPLAPWHGGALGCASAGAFSWISAHSRRRRTGTN